MCSAELVLCEGGILSYDTTDVLGKGSFSTVVRGKLGDRSVAVKRIPRDEDTALVVEREVYALRELAGHDQIVVLLESIADRPDEHILVFELCKHTAYELRGQLSEKHIRLIVYSVLLALRHAHSHQIIHRDVKCSNILVAQDGRVRLADWGWARRLDERRTMTTNPQVATMTYRAPEVLLGSNCYSTPIDIWALGCVFFELFSTKRPSGLFNETRHHLVWRDMVNLLGFPPIELATKWGHLKRFVKFTADIPPYAPVDWDTTFAFIPQNGREFLRSLIAMNPSHRLATNDSIPDYLTAGLIA